MLAVVLGFYESRMVRERRAEVSWGVVVLLWRLDLVDDEG